MGARFPVPFRVLWLPVGAVLLPCAFIAWLGYAWLALDREAATHRSIEAAQLAAGRLRDDLRDVLRVAAEDVDRTLGSLSNARPPFEALPPTPPLVSTAYLFDQAGTLVAPDEAAAVQHAIDVFRQVGAGSRAAATTAAADGTALLAFGRAALAARNAAGVERYSSQIFKCCLGVRDEYGGSLVLYAAWQHVAAYEHSPARDEKGIEVVRQLQQVADRGYLGTPADAAQLSALARKMANAPALVDLATRVERISTESARRRDVGRRAGHWVAQAHPPAHAIVFATLGSSAMTAALATASSGRQAVLILDLAALDSWVVRWGADRESVDTAVYRAGRPAAFAPTIETPLFAEAPAAGTLVVRARVADPVGDRSRHRLFVSAVAIVVCVTMALGYLVVRDVSRDLRTAAMRSAFVAGVTHELKTPLASIRLLAETLRRGRARPEATDELLGTIVEETDRLGRLVDNVLSSSRIESGTRAYHPQVVSLPDVVRRALSRFEYILRQERFVLAEQFDVGPLSVHADPDALQQAVLNLLENAVKYSTGVRQIRVTVERRDECGVVSVADRGIGIAPGERERIFERFYRASHGASDTTGAGLGLALVKHFVEAHEGRVAVESVLGQGSTFSIVLPLAGGAPEAVRPSAAIQEEAPHG